MLISIKQQSLRPIISIMELLTKMVTVIIKAIMIMQILIL